MGLDLLEFVMSIEEHFGIEISDKDAVYLNTHQEVIDYLIKNLKINEKQSLPCETQKAFYRVRRVLIEIARIPRQTIFPSARLEELLSQSERQRIWKDLKKSLGITRWPRLGYPSWIDRILWYSALAVFFFLFLTFAALLERVGIGFVLAILLTGTFAALVCHLTASFRTEIVPAGYTAGDLARLIVVPEKTEKSTTEQSEWTRERIEEDVRAIIMRVFGVRDFSDDSNFVRELGFG